MRSCFPSSSIVGHPLRSRRFVALPRLRDLLHPGDDLFEQLSKARELPPAGPRQVLQNDPCAPRRNPLRKWALPSPSTLARTYSLRKYVSVFIITAGIVRRHPQPCSPSSVPNDGVLQEDQSAVEQRVRPDASLLVVVHGRNLRNAAGRCGASLQTFLAAASGHAQHLRDGRVRGHSGFERGIASRSGVFGEEQAMSVGEG